MTVSFDSLDLDQDTRDLCLQVIRKMAYGKWLEAGSPPGDGLPFWAEAEREWIERHYVPPRLPTPLIAQADEEPAPDRVITARIKAEDLGLFRPAETAGRSSE